MNGIAALVMLLGYGLVFWGLQSEKTYRSNPPVASPNDSCTFHGQDMPCGSLPNNGVGFFDSSGVPARQTADSPGLPQQELGLFVMACGLIFGVVTATNLRRIRNAVTDYTYRQMQSGGGVRCPHCGLVNQNINQFCGRCGKPLAH